MGAVLVATCHFTHGWGNGAEHKRLTRLIGEAINVPEDLPVEEAAVLLKQAYVRESTPATPERIDQIASEVVSARPQPPGGLSSKLS